MKYDFKSYTDKAVFIETGSYIGKGIDSALQAGFQRIYSIELSNYYHNYCVRKYAGNDKVKLYFGDSLDVLPLILMDIQEPCVFWIDAHWMGGEADKIQPGKNPFPLMDELKIIAKHPIKTHTIIIDDMRLVRDKNKEWGTAFPYCTCDIEEFLHTINPLYKMEYQEGDAGDTKDVLIAIV